VALLPHRRHHNLLLWLWRTFLLMRFASMVFLLIETTWRARIRPLILPWIPPSPALLTAGWQVFPRRSMSSLSAPCFVPCVLVCNSILALTLCLLLPAHRPLEMFHRKILWLPRDRPLLLPLRLPLFPLLPQLVQPTAAPIWHCPASVPCHGAPGLLPSPCPHSVAPAFFLTLSRISIFSSSVRLCGTVFSFGPYNG
jgi:hypothetical protein